MNVTPPPTNQQKPRKNACKYACKVGWTLHGGVFVIRLHQLGKHIHLSPRLGSGLAIAQSALLCAPAQPLFNGSELLLEAGHKKFIPVGRGDMVLIVCVCA